MIPAVVAQWQSNPAKRARIVRTLFNGVTQVRFLPTPGFLFKSHFSIHLMRVRWCFGLIIWLLLFRNAFALHPEAHYLSTPGLSGLPCDSPNIQTLEHARLTAWYCKPAQDSSQFLIVLDGGDAGNMSYDIPLAQFFMDNFHIGVLLFDYRGFGR